MTRTLIDLAGVIEADVLEEALDDVLRRRQSSIPRLSRRLNELEQKGRPGIAAIRSLIEARDPSSAIPDSVFETRLLRELKKAGLPKPALQHRVVLDQNIVADIDFAFPSAQVAIEADSYRWHSSRLRWEKDLARRNALTALGWRVVHVTWRDLHGHPEETMRRIGAVITEAVRSGS